MQPVRTTDDAFCIAVLGDFLGGGPRSPEAAEVLWTPRRATPDTVFGLTGLRPRVRVAGGAGGELVEVELASLKSFDPAELFETLPLFAPLREAREAAKAGTPRQKRDDPSPTGGGGDRGRSGPEAGIGSGPGILDAILDKTQPLSAADLPSNRGAVGTEDELGAFVREAVRPHLVQADDEMPTRIAAVDAEASARMAGLLHSGEFQRLEALWRALVVLLSRIDSTGKVRVYLVHLPKRELQGDLDPLGHEDLLGSKLFGLLSSPQLGVQGRRWAAVVGAYGFRFSPGDIRLLERIARVSEAADIPWLSSIRPEASGEPGLGGGRPDSGVEDPPGDWTRLRERPEAAWLGITYPRFLVREPHTGPYRASKVFDFREEITSTNHLQWGDGAVLCAALLAQGFAAGGWGFRPENHLELGGMPLGGLDGDPEGRLSSVETRLSVNLAKAVTDLGIIPLLGFSERAGIRVGGFRSVAASGKFLEAWWRR